jgi:2-keto-3-deoxy-L-rhamnonate aldolase RhmA
VRGCQGDAQTSAYEHHYDPGGSRSLGQEFCMPGKLDTCCVNDTLVHRPRNQRIECSVKATVRSALKRLEDISTVARVEPASDCVLTQWHV